MRLFIAIRLSEEIKQEITEVQNAFRRRNVSGNYTPRENMHLTLAFIGEYNDPDTVLEAMEEVPFRSFRITMDSIGSFGDLWWTGIEGSRELEKLAENLRHRLADAEIPYDRKKFVPHITLLRKAEYRRGAPEAEMEPVSMQVDRISLMQSTRGKNGMIYTELGFVSAK